MKIDILTLFPNMFEGPFNESIVKRACDKNLVKINIHNLRKWSKDKHKTVDGKPFGGGAGMIMRVDIVARALKDLRKPQGSELSFASLQTAESSEPTRLGVRNPLLLEYPQYTRPAEYKGMKVPEVLLSGLG